MKSHQDALRHYQKYKAKLVANKDMRTSQGPNPDKNGGRVGTPTQDADGTTAQMIINITKLGRIRTGTEIRKQKRENSTSKFGPLTWRYLT